MQNAHVPLQGLVAARRVHAARCRQVDSRTNQPSSSSRRVGAGRGAPAFSLVGRRRYPRSWNGFRFLMDANRPDGCAVVTGSSFSRRLQPNELMESRNELEAMSATEADATRKKLYR